MLTELDRLSIVAAIIYSCRGNDQVVAGLTVTQAAEQAYRLLREVTQIVIEDRPVVKG